MNRIKLLISVSLLGLSAHLLVGQSVVNPKPPQGFARPPYHAQQSVLVFGEPYGMSPAMVRNFYGFDRLKVYGEGQTIAIVDAYDHPSIESDLGVFTKQFGLSPCTTANGCFTKVYGSGTQPQVTADWALETALDVEWAHAIAPSAKILLVETTDNSWVNLFQGISLAVSKGANIVSMSFGNLEWSDESLLEEVFQANPQVTFIAASGDSGAGVEFPAASPYVLSVGGTTLETDTTGQRLGEIGWSYSGGGQSLYEVQSPAQAGFEVAGGQGSRNVPDVSYLADVSDGVSVYVTFDYPPYTYSYWYQVGGTSAGAPQWSGILALANSGRVKAGKKTLAESYTYGALDALYGLAKSDYHKNYYDVTKGASGFCGTACIANTGYDLITGLGSPKINNLIPALIAAP